MGSLFILTIGLLTSCDLIEKSPPQIESVLANPDAKCLVWADIDAFGIDSDRIKQTWETHKQAVAAKGPSAVVAMLDNGQIQPELISKLAISIDEIELNEELTHKELLQNIPWVVAVDLNALITADVLVMSINAKTDQWKIKATLSEAWNDFERIDLHDTTSGQFLCSVAVFSANQSQLRIGNPDKILQTFENVKPTLPVDSIPQGQKSQMWLHMKPPPEALEEMEKVENYLPIDIGAMFSGFQGMTTCIKLSDFSLDSLIAFEFKEIEGAENVFSIFQLVTNFAIKPVVKKNLKDANQFANSLKTNRLSNQVQLTSSINSNDMDAIKEFAQTNEAHPLLIFALDLIHPE